MSYDDANSLWYEWIVDHIKEIGAENKFTDVTIVSEDGQQIFAHKVILCIYSDFLREMLKEESETDLIIVPQLTFNNIKMMIDFLYSGIMIITQENMLEFGIVADVLGFGNLIQRFESSASGLAINTNINWSGSKEEDSSEYFLDKKEEASEHTDDIKISRIRREIEEELETN